MAHEHGCGDQHSCGSGTPVTAQDKFITDVFEENDGPGVLPEPMVYGNDKVAITKHKLEEMQVYNCMYKICVDYAIRNVSDKTIATIVFEAKFYNEKGKEMDTVLHKEIEFQPGVSRGIIIPSKNVIIPGVVKSYEVRIIKMTTTETEKVQLRNQDMKIDPVTGGAELRGMVKNISAAKTDAVLLITFGNFKKEVIGEKVIIIRDIEPEQMKKFQFTYKPYGGEMVDSFGVVIVSDIAEMVEEAK